MRARTRRPMIVTLAGGTVGPAITVALLSCQGEDPALTTPTADAAANEDRSSTGQDSGGETGTERDAGDAAPTGRCDPEGAFGAPERVLSLSSSGSADLDVWISADEQRAYVVRDVGGMSTVLFAARPRPGEAFDSPAPAPALASLTNLNATRPMVKLTSNELVAYAHVTGTTIGVAEKTGSAFGAFAQAMSNGVPLEAFSPFITSDGVRLFFSMNPGPHIYFAEKASSVSTFGPAFEVTDLGTSPGWIDTAPVLTPDEKRIFFRSIRPTNVPSSVTQGDIWTAKRGISGNFEGVVNLGTVVNTADDETPASITSDGCVLYFTRRPSDLATTDIWTTTRAR